MIDLDRYFAEFESVEFATQVNIASGFQMFEEIVKESPYWYTFLRELKQRGLGLSHGPELVLNRIKHLLNTDFDHTYENPYDTAFAVYVMALDSEDHEAGMCAAQMLNDVKQLWWTKRVINKIQGLSA